MKINASALTLAVTLLALWALRRLGVDGNTADAITSALLVGLGLSRPAVDSDPAPAAIPAAPADLSAAPAEAAKVIKIAPAPEAPAATIDAPKDVEAPAPSDADKGAA